VSTLDSGYGVILVNPTSDPPNTIYYSWMSVLQRGHSRNTSHHVCPCYV
jgi:hypothetical protein